MVVADSSFSAIDLLDAARGKACVVTRLRLDVRLLAPAQPRKSGTIGRPRRTAERLPTLAPRLADPATPWTSLTVASWYGGTDRRVEIATGVAVWSHPGLPVVPLRWVLVRNPTSAFRPQAFLCTDLNAAAEDILSWFVCRWTIEVTFAEVRRHLGVETQRQWSDKAIARTTPALLGLYALVALWADAMHTTHALAARSARWYQKDKLNFSDALAAVRRQLWGRRYLSISPVSTETIEIPPLVYERMTSPACYAARMRKVELRLCPDRAGGCHLTARDYRPAPLAQRSGRPSKRREGRCR